MNRRSFFTASGIALGFVGSDCLARACHPSRRPLAARAGRYVLAPSPYPRRESLQGWDVHIADSSPLTNPFGVYGYEFGDTYYNIEKRGAPGERLSITLTGVTVHDNTQDFVGSGLSVVVKLASIGGAEVVSCDPANESTVAGTYRHSWAVSGFSKRTDSWTVQLLAGTVNRWQLEVSHEFY